MENVTHALIMAFAVLVFVVALSISMYALNSVNSTAKAIAYMTDETNYYDNINVSASSRTTRIVEADTIVPTLYRYYKENFSVKIFDATSGTKNLLQIFDVDTEGKIYKASAMTNSVLNQPKNREYKLLLDIYGNKITAANASTNPYLFEAPWIGNTKVDTKTRIDLYVKGEVGYINNIKLDYTQNSFKKLLEKQNSYNASATTTRYEFVETFVKYTYTGDTITVENGEDIETITGNKQPEDKVEITYTLKEI